MKSFKGIPVRPDPRLNNTPYRAMNPQAGRYLGMPFKSGTYTYAPGCYDLRTNKDRNKLQMDINHEHIENKKMSTGWAYRPAHLYANRKQRRV